MCDVNSFASAFGSYTTGQAAQIEADSRGMLERAQMESNAVLVQAEARGEEIALRKSFDDQMSDNIAAMAISGLDPESFAGVTEGNRKNLRDNVRRLSASADRRAGNLRAGGRFAEMAARMEGSAAMYSGILTGLNTLSDAATAYQENHTGEGFGRYFAKSIYNPGG